MNIKTVSQWLTVALLAGTFVGSQAWAGSKTVQRTGPNGGSVHKARERGEGYAQRSVDRQYANGAASSGSRTRSYDETTGAYSADRSRSWTGAAGQTASRSRSVTRDDGHATITRQASGPQGQSYGYQRSHGDGHKEASFTTSNGQIASRSRDVVNNGDGTVTVDRQATGLNGASSSSSRTYDLPQGTAP